MQHIAVGISLFILFGIPSLINHIFIYVKHKKLPIVYYADKDINMLNMIFIIFNIITYSVIIASVVSTLIYYLTIFITTILCNT